MIPQIIGMRGSQDTRKAERYFKERGIEYHFVDLAKRSLSEGELDGILRFAKVEELLDTKSREYEKKGLAYMEFDIREELLAEPKLLKQPVLRWDRGVVVGFDPLKWKI